MRELYCFLYSAEMILNCWTLTSANSCFNCKVILYECKNKRTSYFLIMIDINFLVISNYIFNLHNYIIFTLLPTLD